jgi:hypothetical protein
VKPLTTDFVMLDLIKLAFIKIEYHKYLFLGKRIIYIIVGIAAKQRISVISRATK